MNYLKRLRTAYYKFLSRRPKYKIKKHLSNLYCDLFGHSKDTYEDRGWGGGYEKCKRCHRTVRVIFRSKRFVKCKNCNEDIEISH